MRCRSTLLLQPCPNAVQNSRSYRKAQEFGWSPDGEERSSQHLAVGTSPGATRRDQSLPVPAHVHGASIGRVWRRESHPFAVVAHLVTTADIFGMLKQVGWDWAGAVQVLPPEATPKNGWLRARADRGQLTKRTNLHVSRRWSVVGGWYPPIQRGDGDATKKPNPRAECQATIGEGGSTKWIALSAKMKAH